MEQGLKLSMDNIENNEYKEAITEIIQNFKPERIKTINVKMKIIVKTSHFSDPRRLSTPQKIEEKKQIEDWLKKETGWSHANM